MYVGIFWTRGILLDAKAGLVWFRVFFGMVQFNAERHKIKLSNDFCINIHINTIIYQLKVGMF